MLKLIGVTNSGSSPKTNVRTASLVVAREGWYASQNKYSSLNPVKHVVLTSLNPILGHRLTTILYNSPEGWQVDTTTKPFNFMRACCMVKIDCLFHAAGSLVWQKLLYKYHSTLLGGHFGILPITRCLWATFLSPHLKTDVITYVWQCAICQQVNYPTHKPYGLLQPILIPDTVWNDDFITHLPRSNGKTAILLIVDRFSKFTHFLALLSLRLVQSHWQPCSSKTSTIYIEFLEAVLDRDPIFLSSFW